MDRPIESHPKIALDSVEDLRYLYRVLENATVKKIDMHLPRQEEYVGDAVRTKVQELISTFVAQTMQLTKSSVLINGIEPEEELASAKEYETLDMKVLGELQVLHAQLEAETLETTQMRRMVPKQIVEQYKNHISDRLSEPAQEPDELNITYGSGFGEFERQQEVSNMFKKSISLVKSLRNDIPATAAKLERTKDVLDYIVATNKD